MSDEQHKHASRMRRWIGIAGAAATFFGVLSILTWIFRAELAGSRGIVGLMVVGVLPVLFIGSGCLLAVLLVWAAIRQAR
jgi:hypothetical protein